MIDTFPELLRFNISFIFILLIIAISAAMGFWFYKLTNPQSSFVIRSVLAFLRSLLLFLVVILLLNPNLLYRSVEQRPKEIVLLVDHSASMGLQNEFESRKDSTNKTITKIEELAINKHIDLKKYFFNQTVFSASEDSIIDPFGLTNFENLDSFIEKNNLGQIVLISDGNRTEGSIPVLRGNARIFSIGVGNNLNKQYVAILGVEYKPVVYRGKEEELRVRVINNGRSKGIGQLKLFNAAGRLIRSKTVHLNDGGAEQEIVFSYKAMDIGVQKYKVILETGIADANKKNNSFVYTQTVVKGKIQVGIFSSRPNFEHKFIKFVLRESENIEVHSYIRIKNNKTSNYPTDSLDVIIFQDYPANNSNSDELAQIKNILNLNRPGFIVLAGEKTSLQKLNQFSDFLPVDRIIKINKTTMGTLNPTTENSGNPIINLFSNTEQNIDYWNNVPPVEIHFSLRQKNKSKVLLGFNRPGSLDPGLIVRELPDRKSALINGSGLWNWHFSLYNNPQYKDGYRNLILNLIRWSANKTKFKPVVLKANKNTVYPGQEIEFDGFIYSAQNENVKNGRMEIEAIWEDQNFTIQMDSDSVGAYHARYKPISEGRYTFVVKGFMDGKEVGKDKQIVQVIPYNREFIQTNLDSLFLQRIAIGSGGKYFKARNAHNLFDHLDLKPDKIRHENEIELRYKSWLLYLIIGIAALEWIIRKKNNLV